MPLPLECHTPYVLPRLSHAHIEFFESCDKASSLKSKVRERELRQQQRAKVLSQLTSMDVSIPDIPQLRAGCGRSHYRQAMLLMLHATTSPGLTSAGKYKLMEVC